MHDVPYFDRFAPVYDLLLPGTDAAPLEAGLGLAERPLDRVLDLGGGTGRAGSAIDLDAFIFDASQPMLARARAKGHPSIQGDVRVLPFESESVDAIVSVDAIHHLPDIEAVVSEIARVLRPGGVFVVRDFDPRTVRGRGLVFAEHLVGFDSTFFDPETVAEHLETAGLKSTILESGFVYTVGGTKPSE